MLFFIAAISLFLALITEAKAVVTSCKGGTSLIEMNFDDFIVTNELYPIGFGVLPTPYKGFNIVTGGGNHPEMRIMNTSYRGIPYYTSSSTTYPNIAYTDGEPFLMTYSNQAVNQKSFTMLSLSITSIWFNNMAIWVQVSKNGNIVNNTPYSLPVGVPQTILIGETGDRFVVYCANPHPDFCAHMAFDTVKACH